MPCSLACSACGVGAASREAGRFARSCQNAAFAELMSAGSAPAPTSNTASGRSPVAREPKLSGRSVLPAAWTFCAHAASASCAEA
jgi:hypothetical protein